MKITQTFLLAVILSAVSIGTNNAGAQETKDNNIQLPQEGTFTLKGKAINIPKDIVKFDLAVCDPFDNKVIGVDLRTDGTFEKVIPIRGMQDIYLYLGDAVTIFSYPNDVIELNFDFNNLPGSIQVNGSTNTRNRELQLNMELYKKFRKRHLDLSNQSHSDADSTNLHQTKQCIEEYRQTIKDFISQYGKINHEDYLLKRGYFKGIGFRPNDLTTLNKLFYQMNTKCYSDDKQEAIPLYRNTDFNPFLSSAACDFTYNYLASNIGALAYILPNQDKTLLKRLQIAKEIIPDKTVHDWFCALYYKRALRWQGYKPTPEIKGIGQFLIKESTTPEAIKEIQETINQFFNLLKKGEIAPPFTLNDDKGKSVSLKDLKGKVVYLDFWSDGCAPCIQEFKNVNALHKKYEKYDDKIAYVYICIGSNDARWKSLIKQHQLKGINLHALSNDKKIESYNINAVPLYVLIDTEGKLVEFNTSRPSDFIQDQPNILDETLKKLEK